MLQIYFLVSLIFLSSYGYSYFFKIIINIEKKKTVDNLDIFFGIFFIIFFSYIINFFLPLIFFNLIIIFIGLILLLIGIKKKIFKVNFILHLIILFFLIFISYHNGENVDSPMYHHQIINWMILNKINFGIVNLEVRYGLNSSWHSFLALTNINFYGFHSKYYLSLLIFSVLIYESYLNKKFILSDIFLFLSSSYLFLFSFLHPFNNGIILNHLGNPEVDTVAMVFYILSFYIFLKNIENKFNQKNLFNLLIILIFLSITTKISNISLLVLLISSLIFSKSYNFFSVYNILIFLSTAFWTLRSFVISGCLIFPIKQTCFNTTWTNFEKTEYLQNVIQSYSRDTRLRQKYTDFNFTLNSNEWFVPWFNDYFMNTAILKISIFLSLVAIFILLIQNYKKLFFLDYTKILIVFFFFFLSIFVWLKAPEVRFGSGMIISIPSFLLSLILIKFVNFKYINNFFSLVGILLISFLCVKHFHKMNFSYLITNNRIANYDLIEKWGTFNEVDIYYSKNWQCGDFNKICVNSPSKKYNIKKKYNYNFFLNE